LVRALEPGAPLVLPLARMLLVSWAGEYSKFGLLCAGSQLLDALAAGLADWLGVALSRKPWPATSALVSPGGIAGAHARWLGENPLTAVCFPFGALVQLLGKAVPGAPELGAAAADYADTRWGPWCWSSPQSGAAATSGLRSCASWQLCHPGMPDHAVCIGSSAHNPRANACLC